MRNDLIGRIWIVLALASGCGGPSGGAADLAVPDVAVAPPDLLPPPDLFQYPVLDLAGARVACGVATCAPGQECCVPLSIKSDAGLGCAVACGADQFGEACTGPSDCGGYPCCFTVSQGAHGAVSIGDNLCSRLPTDCRPAIDTLNGVLVTRRCDTNADCTAYAPDTTVDKCCSITAPQGTLKLCGNATLAALLKGTIVCPP